MKQFADKDFSLNTKTAESLFRSIGGLPLIDFHSRLSAEEIATNRTFRNITELWLSDEEKLSAMRCHGIDEYYITGEAGDYEKFQKWAETVPNLLGSPLYQQTHLELQRFFGIYEPLSPATAERIWNCTNAQITSDNFTVYHLLQKFNVQLIGISQDACDSLEYFTKISEDGLCPAQVLPIFDLTNAMSIADQNFNQWLSILETVCSQEITDYSSLQSCLVERLLFFKSIGSKTAYQTFSGVLTPFATFEQADRAFQKKKKNLALTSQEIAEFQSHLFGFLCKKYRDYGFLAEIEVSDKTVVNSILYFLETLSSEHPIPKIVLSSNCASTYEKIAETIFSSPISKDIQVSFFNEKLYQKNALRTVLSAISSYGLLPRFFGFSSGSKSLLSYPVHEYFRRILADFIGNLIEQGEYPNYPELTKKIAENIAYRNAKNSFNL